MSENISIRFHFFQFHGASLLFSAQDGAHSVGVAALKIQAIVEATLLTEDLKTTASVPRAVTDRHGTSSYDSYELREWMAMDCDGWRWMAPFQVFDVFIKLKRWNSWSRSTRNCNNDDRNSYGKVTIWWLHGSACARATLPPLLDFHVHPPGIHVYTHGGQPWSEQICGAQSDALP